MLESFDPLVGKSTKEQTKDSAVTPEKGRSGVQQKTRGRTRSLSRKGLNFGKTGKEESSTQTEGAKKDEDPLEEKDDKEDEDPAKSKHEKKEDDKTMSFAAQTKAKGLFVIGHSAIATAKRSSNTNDKGATNNRARWTSSDSTRY